MENSNSLPLPSGVLGLESIDEGFEHRLRAIRPDLFNQKVNQGGSNPENSAPSEINRLFERLVDL